MINNTIHKLLRFSSTPHNFTAEQLNMAFGDTPTALTPDLTPEQWQNIFSFICVFVLVGIGGVRSNGPSIS
jgi:hypothetical protein